MKQTTSHILMVRPVSFRYNEQTAVNNHYMEAPEKTTNTTIQHRAQQEFDDFVTKLRYAGVTVTVIEDTATTSTPDSIFPNNWISFHRDGKIILYPMFAENRREERKLIGKVKSALEQAGLSIREIIDYSAHELEGKYLEGTGSMIFDRKHGKVYVNISERAHEDLAKKFAKDLGVELVTFHAFQSVDGQDFPIYHTNVMMCLGDEFAVICLDAIRDETERAFVRSHLEQSGKTIIRISESQCAAFAGNMLNVRNANGESIIVMSGQAFQSLERQQIEKLEQFGKLLFSDLETIETCGGGSARCMMAEVFLEK